MNWNFLSDNISEFQSTDDALENEGSSYRSLISALYQGSTYAMHSDTRRRSVRSWYIRSQAMLSFQVNLGYSLSSPLSSISSNEYFLSSNAGPLLDLPSIRYRNLFV